MDQTVVGLHRLETLGEDLRALLELSDGLSREAEELRDQFYLRRIAFRREFERLARLVGPPHSNHARAGCMCSWRCALDCAAENRAARKSAASNGAGVEMDRRVAFHLAGERAEKVPPFSTCRSACNRLVRRLEREGLAHKRERAGDQWFSTWARKSDGATVATGSGNGPALAVCRSVLNLDLGRIRPAIPSASQSETLDDLRARALVSYR